jgi:ribosome maturation factor RimP
MDVVALLEQTLPALGYELVDVEASPHGRIIRIFIDKPAGVDVEDCARVSNHLTRLFTVENVAYDRLEVSSPGLDRPLKRIEDFVRFAGAQVRLKLHTPQDNARKLEGVLKGVQEQTVLLETARGPVAVAFDNVDRARLVPQIEWRKR